MMKMTSLGKYNKGIVSILTAIGIGIQSEYPASHWSILATGIIGAVLVVLVPNSKDASEASVATVAPKVPGETFTPSPDTLNLLGQLADHALIERTIASDRSSKGK
jgi:hypothetical protein